MSMNASKHGPHVFCPQCGASHLLIDPIKVQSDLLCLSCLWFGARRAASAGVFEQFLSQPLQPVGV